MKRFFTREFWSTPLTDAPTLHKATVLMLLGIMFLACVIIGGIAAWRIIY